MIKTKRVLIYGPHPQANGGVETHMRRFLESIENTTNFKYEFYHYYKQMEKLNFKYLTPWELFIKGIRKDYNVLLIHQFQHWKIHFLVSVLAILFRVKVIVYYHNNRFRDFYYAVRPVLRVFTRVYFFSCTKIISVNPKTDFLFIKSNKIVNIPAFIPPSYDELNSNNLPEQIIKFRNRFNKIIVSNAAKLTFYKNEDLYGFDISIELIKLLVQRNFSDIGLILVVPDIVNVNYYNKLIKLIKDYMISEQVLIYSKHLSFPALLKISDIFVRPTNTDGDALSVRESIYLGVPVIASNSTNRPEGCTIFENRSLEDYYEKVVNTINNLELSKEKISNIKSENFYKKIINVINNI